MRVVVCDDHRLFVQPLAAALGSRGHEAAIALTPAQAVRMAQRERPDLVVLDLRFPDGSSLDAVAALAARVPGLPVVVLSGSADPGDEVAATRAGAAAFLRKDQPLRTLFDAFERIASGRGAVPVPAPALPRSAWSAEHARVRALVDRLTERERETLRHLLRAEDTATIAQAMGVAASTIRTHLESVLLKLGVHSRLKAVAVVVAAGVDGEL